jgi:tetratricopeptide (TPR) repeat protein
MKIKNILTTMLIAAIALSGYVYAARSWDQSRIDQLVRARRYSNAISVIQEYLKRSGLNGVEQLDLLNQLAAAQHAVGQRAQAQDTWIRMSALPAYRTSPLRFSVPVQLSKSHQQQGNRDQAVSVLLSAMDALSDEEKTSPQGLELQYQAGMAQYNATDYRRAADTFLELFKHPTHGQRRTLLYRLVSLYSIEALTDIELDSVLGEVAQSEKDYNFLSRLAQAYKNRGREKNAVETYFEIIRQYPSLLVDMHAPITKYLSTTGHVDEMIALIDKLRGKEKLNYRVHILYARVLAQVNRVDEALEALAPFNHMPQVAVERANLLFQQKQFIEAADAYNTLLKASPTRVDLIDKLGLCYLKLNKKEMAIATWRKIVQQPRVNYNSYQMLSNIFQRNGFPKESLESLREASKLSPQSRMYAQNMAYHWILRGDYMRAIEALSGSVSLSKTPRYGSDSLILPYIKGEAEQKELYSAIMEYRTSTPNLKPQQEIWLRSLQRQLLVQLGRYREALDMTQKATRGKNAELYALAKLFEDHNAQEWAIFSYRAIVPDPALNYPAIKVRLAELYSKRSQFKEARASLLSASETLPPTDRVLRADILLHMAQVELELKSPEPALSLLSHPAATDTLKLAPEYLEYAQLLRGEAYSMMGALPRARRELTPLLESKQRGLRLMAVFQMGNVNMWEGKSDEAAVLYREILDNDLGHDLANDVLDLVVSAALYDGEQMGFYSQALYYGWQGRAEDAVEQWRQLAAYGEDGDLVAAALEEAADAYIASGTLQAASTEYGKALRFAKSPDVIGRIRWSLLEEVRKGDTPPTPKDYENLIIEFPETIYADLARRKLTATKPEETLPVKRTD